MAIHFKHRDSEISILKNNGLEYLLIGVIAFFIYQLSVHHFGLGTTNDSLNYINAALTINEGMKKIDGSFFCEWPPLYPLILSASKLLKINILQFAQFLNGIVFIANILLCTKILKENILSKEVYILSILFLLFSIPLLQMHILVWSEPIFILLLLLNLFALKRYFENNSNLNLLILIVIGMLMYLQRKTGIYFIINTVYILFLYKSARTAITKTTHSIVYLSLCFIPIYLWQKRTLKLSGNIFVGGQYFEPGKLFINIEQSFHTFSTWLLPHTIHIFFRLIILSTITAYVVVMIYKNKNIYKELINNRIFNFCLINCTLYILILIATLTYVHLDEEIDDRILSPAYLPFLIIFFILVDKIYLHYRVRIYLKKYFIIGSLIFISYPIFRTFHHINRWNSDGPGGYNSSSWRENQILITFHRKNFNADTIYTNNIYAMKYFLNYKWESKYKVFPQSELTKDNKALYVCFEKEWHYPGNECITPNSKKIILANTNDGHIYQLNK